MNDVSKQGRARAPVSARLRADSVVSQGRRAGQPLSARVSSSIDVPRAARQPGPAVASPGRKPEGEVGGFGRVQSEPNASVADGGDKRIRVVHQEKGPYRTIQAALSEALDGDIVSVSPGVYAEQLQIERDNVRIVGKIRNGGEVVLKASPDAWTVRVGRDAGNYRMENLVFRKDSPTAEESTAVVGAHAGIAALRNKLKGGMLALAKAEKEMQHHNMNSGGYAAIVGAGRVTFLNCTFTGPCGGVLVTGDGAESLIFGCRFSGLPAGMPAVHIEERARARVRRCIFDKCLGMGVQVVKSECTIDDNAFTDMFNYSVQFALNSAGNVRANTFVSGRKANVAVSGKSAPVIERNTVKKSYATGMFVFDEGLPSIEANEFYECMLAAIEVRDEGSDPMVLNNTIRDGSDGGIVVHNNARATVKGNTISGNKKAGITLCTGASAIVTENNILGGKGAGILCHTDAGGVLRGNRISQVEKAGVEIRKRASTEVLANVIFNCSAQGVHVHSEGKGNIEGNTISKCKGPLVEICGASAPVLKHNQLEGGVGGAQGFLVYDRACPEIANNILKECAKAAIHISDYALPTEHGIVVCGAVGEGCIIEENEIVGCQLAGIDVSKEAAPSVSHNIVERGAGSGIHVHDGGRGVFAQNTVRLNTKAGVVVRTSAQALLVGNNIIDGKATGVYVYDEGRVEIKEGNKIERNAFHGVAVRDGGVLEMSGSKILKSGQNGVFVYAKGVATVNKCEILGSGNVGVIICEGSSAEDLRGNSKPLRNDDNCTLEQVNNKVL